MTLERVVRPAGPFTLAHCRGHASDATRHMRDGTLTAALRVGERIEVGSARQTVDGRVVLHAETEEGLERLRFVLAVDADHSEFLRRFARDPLINSACPPLRRRSCARSAASSSIPGALASWSA